MGKKLYDFDITRWTTWIHAGHTNLLRSAIHGTMHDRDTIKASFSLCKLWKQLYINYSIKKFNLVRF